jgi:hypothetical protein
MKEIGKEDESGDFEKGYMKLVQWYRKEVRNRKKRERKEK